MWLVYRRMFPTLALSILGMDPRKNYAIHVDIVPVDGYSYTFVNNMWQVNGMASEMHHLPYVQSYQADEVARSGLYWMKNGVDFKKVRLTNRRTGSFKEGEVRQNWFNQKSLIGKLKLWFNLGNLCRQFYNLIWYSLLVRYSFSVALFLFRKSAPRIDSSPLCKQLWSGWICACAGVA